MTSRIRSKLGTPLTNDMWSCKKLALVSATLLVVALSMSAFAVLTDASFTERVVARIVASITGPFGIVFGIVCISRWKRR
jgi:hypothetical protein